MSERSEVLRKLRARQPHTRRVTITLNEDAVDEAAAAVAAHDADAGGEPPAAVEPDTVTFVVQNLSAAAYNELLAEHPPSDVGRKSGEAYDAQTFAPALIQRCLAEPDLSDGDFAQLFDALSNSEATLLFSAALAVNTTTTHIEISR